MKAYVGRVNIIRETTDAAVLTTPGALGQTHELVGDQAVTMTEVAALVSAKVGRPIPYQSLPEGDYTALLQTFGLPTPVAAIFADADAQAARGALFNDGGALSRLIGRPATPVAESVAAAL